MPETVQAAQLRMVDTSVLRELERRATAGELPIYGYSLEWEPYLPYSLSCTITLINGWKVRLRSSDWVVIDRNNDLSVYSDEVFYNKFRRA
jgi:hypothetical protein